MKTLLALLLTLTLGHAHGVPSFPGAGGNYGGTIDADSTGDPNNSGILTVVMNEFGSASLSLVWQGQTYKLKGAFTGDFVAGGQLNRTNIVKKTPQTPGTKLSLFCNLDPSSRTIGGVVSDPEASSGGGFIIDGNPPDSGLVAQLDPGLRMAFIDDAVAPAPREGPQRGGFALPPTTGTGFTIVTIGTSGKRANRSVGRLADAQPYSAGSPLRNRSYALRGGLYPQPPGQPSGGQILGNSTPGSMAAAEGSTEAPRSLASLIAALRWHKRPNLSNARSYPGGFDGRVNLDTIPYTRGRDLRFLLTGVAADFANASLVLSGGNIGPDITVKLNLTIFGARIAGPNPNAVALNAKPFLARFNGSFRHPGNGERVKFNGAFRSATGAPPNVVPGEGKGTFLGIDRNDPANSQSGKVRIPPAM